MDLHLEGRLPEEDVDYQSISSGLIQHKPTIQMHQGQAKRTTTQRKLYFVKPMIAAGVPASTP